MRRNDGDDQLFLTSYKGLAGLSPVTKNEIFKAEEKMVDDESQESVIVRSIVSVLRPFLQNLMGPSHKVTLQFFHFCYTT